MMHANILQRQASTLGAGGWGAMRKACCSGKHHGRIVEFTQKDLRQCDDGSTERRPGSAPQGRLPKSLKTKLQFELSGMIDKCP